MSENPPYLASPGVLTTVLNKIKSAATPPRFTQDFLKDTLAMSGGSAMSTIPYLKKIGFLSGDGTPTDIYIQFRNSTKSKHAVANSMKFGYRALFERNENAHKLSEDDLKGLVVEATGLDQNNKIVTLIVSCFKILKSQASFDAMSKETTTPSNEKTEFPALPSSSGNSEILGMNLSYTINLNLPASTDVEVFNAIFRSLRENLLRNG